MAAGDKLAIDSSGHVVTASGNAQVIGWAEAAIAEAASGTIFFAPVGMYSVDGSTLASGKIWVGNGSNVAAAVTPSGDVTIDNTGATTIGAKKVVAHQSMLKGTTQGCLLRVDASNVVSEFSCKGATAIVCGDGTDVTSTVMSGDVTISSGVTTIGAKKVIAHQSMLKGTTQGCLLRVDGSNVVSEFSCKGIGDIVCGDGTDVKSTTMSGDATISNGVLTIGNKKVTAAKMYSAAQGCIFRTDAANAVSELSLADGKIAVGDGTDVAALSVKTAGTVVYGNGTTLTTLALGSGGQKLMVKPSGSSAAASAIAWDSGITVKANLSGMDSSNDPVLTGVDYTAADLATGNRNRCQLFDGTSLGYYILGAGQTIEGPVGATDGIDVAADQTDNEGLELFSNYLYASGAPICVHHTPAFYFLVKFSINTINGCDDLFVGFRLAEGVQVNMEDYNSFFGLGLNTVANPGAVKVRDELNGAGAANTDTTQTLAGATDVQFKILVSATGVCTCQHDIAAPGTLAAPTQTHAMTFDNGDVVVPTFRFLHANAAQAGAIVIKDWQVGLQ